MKERCKAGRERRVDRGEVEIRALKEALDNKAKRKLERACKGGGWDHCPDQIPNGNDLYRKDFRDYLRCRLNLTLQPPPYTS